MKNNQLKQTITHPRRSTQLAAPVLMATLLSVSALHTVLADTTPVTSSASSFAVLGGTAVTLTDATIVGDVGSPTAVTVTTSTVAGTVYPAGDAIANAAYSDFLLTYNTLALEPCSTYLTGDLAGQVLLPGVYCVEAASTTSNGTLTLDAQGNTAAKWLFKIGTGGTGALTGTGLSVVMSNSGQPCNVNWWVAEAVTMSASSFKGNVLAGTAATFTDGSLIGQVLAQAGVTMTGTNVFGCSRVTPPKDNKHCWKHDKDDDKHHGKKHHDEDDDKHHDKNKHHDKDD